MTDTLDRLSAALADRYRVERHLGEGGMATVYPDREPSDLVIRGPSHTFMGVEGGRVVENKRRIR